MSHVSWDGHASSPGKTLQAPLLRQSVRIRISSVVKCEEIAAILKASSLNECLQAVVGQWLLLVREQGLAKVAGVLASGEARQHEGCDAKKKGAEHKAIYLEMNPYSTKLVIR